MSNKVFIANVRSFFEHTSYYIYWTTDTHKNEFSFGTEFLIVYYFFMSVGEVVTDLSLCVCVCVECKAE